MFRIPVTTQNWSKMKQQPIFTEIFPESSQKLYEYDNMGNVTAYWSPLAEGDKANTLYKTEYQYFISSASTNTFDAAAQRIDSEKMETRCPNRDLGKPQN